MQYFVVQNRATGKNSAVVFHDYLTKHYIVQSSSDIFRRAFDAAIKSLGSVTYTAVKDKLFKSYLTLDNPSWAKEVLKKACGSTWAYSKKGELLYDTQIDDIIAKYL